SRRVPCALALRQPARLARAPPPPWAGPPGFPFAACPVAALAAAGPSTEPLSSAVPAVKGVLLSVTFYVTLDALPDAGAADRFLCGLLVLVAIVALLGIVQVAICPGPGGTAAVLGPVGRKCHRARGFYSIYMTLAGVLSLV